jgi:hypothetical protein
MYTKQLLDLPDETLLEIVSNVAKVQWQKRQYLMHTSLVCRRLRSVAIEELLLNLVVHIYNIHGLVRTYLKHPEITDRVRSLELLTHGRRDFGPRNTFRAKALHIYAPHMDEQFKTDCIAIIQQSSLSPEMKR